MKIAVVFGNVSARGAVFVVRGSLKSIGVVGGGGSVVENSFEFQKWNCRLELSVADANVRSGAYSTIINIFTEENPFSFNLRDVCSATPVFVPEFSVAVIPADDERTYEQVAKDIKAKKLCDDFARFELEPEESRENAASQNRKQSCQTWLGIGRDMRIFRVGYQGQVNAAMPYDYWGQIQPVYHATTQKIPGQEDEEFSYQLDFVVGHGSSCRPKITRRLEDGVLPILRSVQHEQDMNYHITAFATLENEPLSKDNVRGSADIACYPNVIGCMHSPEEIIEIKDTINREKNEREQEVVCCLQIEAVNTGKVPRYAWFKSPYLMPFNGCGEKQFPDSEKFSKGLTFFENAHKVIAVSRLEGELLAEEETAVLVPPGEKIVFDMLIPHSPVSFERGKQLATLNVKEHLDACRKFWRKKLQTAAKVSIPEKHIDESIQAGLLHCDLVTLGLEPDGTALATVGWYGPIGTESAPIIQYYDSMGWHNLAERCLKFFFDRQHNNGLIQVYSRYESETGAFLWTVGEHYRYTRNRKWLLEVLPKIKKSVSYLLQWRERNLKEEYREKGFYGLLDGKVADPEDFYHSFFLNAGAFIGLKRIAEICLEIEPDYGRKLTKEVESYRQDLKNSFYFCQARSPLIPIGNGSWAPFLPPWVNYTGGISLYADGGKWFSHGAFGTRNSLIGPMWLIISEVLEPDEIGAHFMIKTNQYPASLENAALSQPYYCRHDFAHIKRREVKPFLKTFYNQLTGLQDCETYTWWEHYWHAGEHKTHEEAWFLMQTRWMLWLEDRNTLSLLRGIPRRWLEDDMEIAVENVRSYFGALSFRILSNIQNGKITAEISCDAKRLPEYLEIRLPHPEGLRARKWSAGNYDSDTESIILKQPEECTKITIEF